MYADQFNILVGLLKEIRDRLPADHQDKIKYFADPVPMSAPDEAATQKFPAYLPDLVPYTIEHPVTRTQVETRRAYVDQAAQIRFLPPEFPPGSGWRALWIEREAR